MTEISIAHPVSRMRAPMVWLLMAISSVVFIEPAPYDLLLLALVPLFFLSGLRVPREIQLAGLLIGLFTLANVVAAVAAPRPEETFRSLSIRSYMALSWLFFVCVVAAEPKRTLKFLWNGYLVAAVVATAFGIAEYFGYVQSIEWEPGLRAKGPFKDPNVFGPFLVPVALHCLARVQAAGPLRAPVHLGLFLLFCFGILLSFSRGAWIDMILSLGVFGVLSLQLTSSPRQRMSWLLTCAGMAAAVVVMVLVALTSKTVADRFEQRAVVAQAYDLRETGRFPIQKRSLKRIGVAPLGIGPGRSEIEFPQGPHNIYLHIPLEGGWLAGLAWYVFAIYTMTQAARALRWRSELRVDLVVIFSALVGVLAQSAFISSTHWRHFWMLLALAWALIITARRDTVPAPMAAQTARA